MADLIKRDNVLVKIDEFVKLNAARGFPMGIFDIEMMRVNIAKIPTDDVAPVVRCKDCTNHGHCVVEDCFVLAKLNDDRRFCGAGERKEQNNG